MSPEQICMGCMEDHGGAAVCSRCGWKEGLPPSSPLYLAPRSVLADQFMVGKVLGHGGFGILYLAWDLRLERKVAVKEYMPQGIAGRAPGTTAVAAYQNRDDYEWGLGQFLDEARMVARFAGRPDVVSVITFFRENQTGYIVMEYLEGASLLDFVDGKGGRIPYDAALRIMTPVMDALREVHQTGVLHRDISPDNVFITRAGLVKVLDFGAARQALGQKSRNLSVILKEGYAPEEQYRSKGNQGPWTDVYATAATFYRILTGKIPPPATDRTYQDELLRPGALGTTIPVEAEAALMRALAVRAENRFSSMEEFQAALLGNRAPVDPGPVLDLAPPGRVLPPQGHTTVRIEFPQWMRTFPKSLRAAVGALGSALTQRSGPPAGLPPRERRLSARPVLRGVSGYYADTTLELSERPWILGSDARVANLVFPPQVVGISKRHCLVRFDPARGSFVLEDSWSTNGTFLDDGSQLAPGRAYELTPGHRFYLGDGHTMFEVGVETG